MGNKFRMSTTPVSKKCQTIYFDKDVLHDKGQGLECQKLLMTVFVYNYVILKYSVFFFVDLKKMATAICGDKRYVDDLRILPAIELFKLRFLEQASILHFIDK